eukprot:TRINITY_DN9857_c0_g1_i1.p1 TRINITY_DN9857_c0_g1~~TRINITY_DN9857_c0_g1_i1.p1  ORF type:complete len:402 (-),score=103.02 TRINITY_DN9857_c0_g1_i1:109-1314(-)
MCIRDRVSTQSTGSVRWRMASLRFGLLTLLATARLCFAANPAQPEGCVSITATSTSCIGLEWPAVTGATSYQVWSVRAEDGASEKVYDGTALNFTFLDAIASSTYTFVYKAVNDDGASTASRQSPTTGTAANKTRNLYVSDHAGDRVLKFHAEGQFFMEFVQPGHGGLSKPWGIAQGPTGDVFVASGGTSSVLQYAQCTGAFVRMLCYVPGQPRGLSFRTNDQGVSALYAASHFMDKVLMFDATTGAALGSFASVKMPWALGWSAPLAASAPDLFVTSEDTVLRFNGSTGGFVSKYIDKQVNYASGLAFSADASKTFVTGPYAGNLIAVFEAAANESTAHLSSLFTDQYMKRCQGLVRYNESLFAACRDQIRSYDAETGEFLSVFAQYPNLLSSFLLFIDE